MCRANESFFCSTRFNSSAIPIRFAFGCRIVYNRCINKRKAVFSMAPITREQALENALASSRIEGYEVTEQTRADCRRLMDGKVDARTLAAEILARRKAQQG